MKFIWMIVCFLAEFSQEKPPLIYGLLVKDEIVGTWFMQRAGDPDVANIDDLSARFTLREDGTCELTNWLPIFYWNPDSMTTIPETLHGTWWMESINYESGYPEKFHLDISITNIVTRQKLPFVLFSFQVFKDKPRKHYEMTRRGMGDNRFYFHKLGVETYTPQDQLLLNELSSMNDLVGRWIPSLYFRYDCTLREPFVPCLEMRLLMHENGTCELDGWKRVLLKEMNWVGSIPEKLYGTWSVSPEKETIGYFDFNAGKYVTGERGRIWT